MPTSASASSSAVVNSGAFLMSFPYARRAWTAREAAASALHARHRKRLAGLAAQVLVYEAGRKQFTDPAQPDVARRCEVVVGQAVPGVGFGELAHTVPHPPAQLQVRKRPDQLGEVDAVVAQVRPSVFGERYPGARHRVTH